MDSTAHFMHKATNRDVWVIQNIEAFFYTTWFNLMTCTTLQKNTISTMWIVISDSNHNRCSDRCGSGYVFMWAGGAGLPVCVTLATWTCERGNVTLQGNWFSEEKQGCNNKHRLVHAHQQTHKDITNLIHISYRCAYIYILLVHSYCLYCNFVCA